jgi:hypothetical protein
MPFYLLLAPSRPAHHRRPAREPGISGLPTQAVTPPSAAGERPLGGGPVLRTGVDSALSKGRDGELDPAAGIFA